MKDQIEMLMHEAEGHKRHHAEAEEEKRHKGFLLDQLAHESDDSEPEGEGPGVRRFLKGMVGLSIGAVVLGLVALLWGVSHNLNGYFSF
jgi:hypothetical protein